MANNTLVSTVIKIGGALDATWAAATKTVEDRIKALDEQASKARGWRRPSVKPSACAGS